MKPVQLGEVEARFANLIWNRAPLASSALVSLAGEALGWKKSTTYTVLKRLCDKGLFQNDGGTAQSEQFVEETFSGSLPAFLAAFTSRKKLTPQEVAALREMIETYEEDAP